MEIKLPIYDKKEVVKTYTAETYDIMFGTVEDLINVIDIDKFTTGKNEDLLKGVVQAIPGAFGLIKPLLKDVFDGLTDDEIKHTKVKDVAAAIVKIIKYSLSQIVAESNSKN